VNDIKKGLTVAALLAALVAVMLILAYYGDNSVKSGGVTSIAVSPSPVAAATPSQVESSVPLLPETPAATPTPTPYADILKEGIANMKKIEVPL